MDSVTFSIDRGEIFGFLGSNGCGKTTTMKMLILDEPTSAVDPVARDAFWELLIELSRKDKVTIFISTHFMNEAMRCDRISLMHAGKVLACDMPNSTDCGSRLEES